MKSLKSVSILIASFGILFALLLGYKLFLAAHTLKESKSEIPKVTLPPCEKQVSKDVCVKIGQMLIVGFGGMKQDSAGQIVWQDPDGIVFKESSIIANQIRNQYVGGIILHREAYRSPVTREFIRDRNIQNPSQLAKLTGDLENFSKKVRNEQGLPELPLMISIDQEGGMVNSLSVSLNFPLRTIVPQALGANEELVMSDPELKQKALAQTRSYAEKMTSELTKAHINTNFAPCVDVNITPLNMIIGALGRSFSSNPEIVVDQATQFIQAFQTQGVIPVLKHFPGHGSSLGDTHLGLVDVTNSYQKEKELFPYKDLIAKGYQDIIMTTHVINGQIDKTQCKEGLKDDPKTWCPGTMSYTTLTTLLRNELGFRGIIVSDDMQMKAIANEYPLEDALEKAIHAGVEMFIISNNEENNTAKVVDNIAKLVKEGKVSEAQIDRAYQNIIQLKKKWAPTSR